MSVIQRLEFPGDNNLYLYLHKLFKSNQVANIHWHWKLKSWVETLPLSPLPPPKNWCVVTCVICVVSFLPSVLLLNFNLRTICFLCNFNTSTWLIWFYYLNKFIATIFCNLWLKIWAIISKGFCYFKNISFSSCSKYTIKCLSRKMKQRKFYRWNYSQLSLIFRLLRGLFLQNKA